MPERVQMEWKEDEPIALQSLHAFLDQNPEAKQEKYAVYVAHASMAAQMLEHNPSPAMFREFNVAWKALRLALETSEASKSLGDLINDA
jgi:hypothetical protein